MQNALGQRWADDRMPEFSLPWLITTVLSPILGVLGWSIWRVRDSVWKHKLFVAESYATKELVDKMADKIVKRIDRLEDSIRVMNGKQ